VPQASLKPSSRNSVHLVVIGEMTLPYGFSRGGLLAVASLLTWTV
jgi:hypothetical protein